MIKLYNILKIQISDIIKSKYDLHIFKENEDKYLIRQQDTPLFRQIALVRGYDTNRINELIFVQAKHNKKRRPQLEKLLKEGFQYNNISYVRFGKSSSQAKDGITVFINKDYYKEIMERSQLGVKIDKCVVSKYESYRCLIFSACQFVEEKLPHIVIVDEYTKIIPNQYVRYAVEKDVEYIDKDTKEKKIFKNQRVIEEGYKDIKISPFDGFGVHTKKMSDIWGKYLDLEDYTHIGYQIRLPILKGMSIEAPIQDIFADMGVSEIVDIFGVSHKVEDIDCIWNTTMWKGYGIFKENFGNNAWNEYIDRVNKYGFKLGISKYSHHTKDLNLRAKMNFQYLQCLDLQNPKYLKHYKSKDDKYNILDDNNWGKIINIAKYTTDLYEKIIKGNKLYTLHFLGINESNLDDVNGKYIKAILTNDIMLKDPCIKSMIKRKLDKAITQMKFGKIYTDGFYHTITGDIVGYLQYCAKKTVKGCLNAGEFYCKTLPLGKCLSFRSPLVDPSEVNEVNIVENDITNKYFENFKDQDICMINMYDLTMPQQGGCDADGDSFYLCCNDIIKNSKIHKPIVVDVEDKKTTDAVDYNLDSIVNYECNSRDNRIGEITNIATSILNSHTEDKNWQKINADNVSLLRLYQGKEIDFIKVGYRWILTKHLRKYLKKLPFFLLYNYPQKLNVYYKIKKINKENEVDNRIPYNAYKSPSALNELCEYVNQWEKHKLIWDRSVVNTGYLLINDKLDLSNKYILKQIKGIINAFTVDFKEVLDKESDEENDKPFDILFDKYRVILSQIKISRELLANYCIKVCYQSIGTNKVLTWGLYGDIILKNLKDNSPNTDKYEIVLSDKNDNESHEYLGKWYKITTTKEE